MTKKIAIVLYIIGWSSVLFFDNGEIILLFVTLWQGILAIIQQRIFLGVMLILFGPLFGWAFLSVFEQQNNDIKSPKNIEEKVTKRAAEKEQPVVKVKKPIIEKNEIIQFLKITSIDENTLDQAYSKYEKFNKQTQSKKLLRSEFSSQVKKLSPYKQVLVQNKKTGRKNKVWRSSLKD